MMNALPDESGRDGVVPERAFGLGYRPLYRQVRDVLVSRLAAGEWQPGEILPSEPQLAAELGVSQGTVRKALDAMTAENLLTRRQGRGTFVARHDEPRIRFQFFRLTPDEGTPVFPESRVLGAEEAPASEPEQARLGLLKGTAVIRIRRVRSMDGKPRIVETISLPGALFPGLLLAAIPNNLYDLYASRYGVRVASARERLKAVAIGTEDAALIEAKPGEPVLEIDRIALSLDGTAVEWRVSLCSTGDLHYRSDTR